MAKRSVIQPKDGGSTPTPSLQIMHDTAKERFLVDRSKCYQRHIRELYAETEAKEQIPSLEGARVRAIRTEEAAKIILKYEWLRTMGSGTTACYGLLIGDELIGVACFGVLGGNIRRICIAPTPAETNTLAEHTICLMRGACVPHAPKNAASFLIRNACRQANKDHGWRVFFAYSDSDAGELGTVYQSVGWYYLGDGIRKSKYHTDYQSPDGSKTITSYTVNHKHLSRTKLLTEGWVPIQRYNKRKYVWFEGTRAEKNMLKSWCRYPLLAYPKRITELTEARVPSSVGVAA